MYELNPFQNASAEYQRKVERVAARLIRQQGMPPFEAVEKAKAIVATQSQSFSGRKAE